MTLDPLPRSALARLFDSEQQVAEMNGRIPGHHSVFRVL
jgi:hypothetical protein